MSSFKPPDAFNPDASPAEAWQRWRQRFVLYHEASDLMSKPIPQQRAILLHVLGEVGLDIYNTLEIVEVDDARTVTVILDAFTAYYRPYMNTTYRRHLFFSSSQTETQTIDQFVTELKSKARECDFANLADSLVRDILICGIRDSVLRERLLREPVLTLALAIDICRADESSKLQNKQMQTTVVQAINTARKEPFQQKKEMVNEASGQYFPRRRDNSYGGRIDTGSSCPRCLRRHQPRNCPAFGKTCNKCGMANHFAAGCRRGRSSMAVQEMSLEREYTGESDDFFVGSLAVNGMELENLDWIEDVEIQGSVIPFKLDTGSHVDVMPLHIFEQLPCPPELKPYNKRVTTYSGHLLPIEGECSLKCRTRNSISTRSFLVVKTNAMAILGLPSIQALSLVSRVSLLSVEEQCEAQNIIAEYEDVFKGIGKLPGTHHITLMENALPKVHAPRRIPFALHEKVKAELELMERQGIITKELEPTDWVHPIVIVQKPNGEIRICIDPRELNDSIKREHLQMPTQETIFSQLNDARVFTVLDASRAFWQIELDLESSKLCTFTTPFGRFRFLRMPYGIKSAPEVYQRKLNDIFQGLPGTASYIDDSLVWAKDGKEHNKRLRQTLARARENNLKLKIKKLQLSKDEVTFLGHKVSSSGIQILEDRVEAVEGLNSPRSKQELQRFLGIINYLSKFIDNHSSRTEYLRKLATDKVPWMWDSQAEEAFKDLKKAISSAPVLALFDPNKQITLSVDASKQGTGSVMLQEGKPIAYSSVTFNDTQRNYAPIELELLAVVTACERFHYFIFGKDIVVETDHKPLVSIIQKPMDKLSPRIQRLVLRLMRYQINLVHVPGKAMFVADALSRDPLVKSINTDYLEGQACVVHGLVVATPERINQIKKATAEDDSLQKVTQYLKEGWPDQLHKVSPPAKPFWSFKEELHSFDSLLFRGERLVVPKSMKKEILQKLHASHQGMVACKNKARESVFWPGMSKDIEECVRFCVTCQKHAPANVKEPLHPHLVPDRPWDRLGVDFMKLKGVNYILVIDYHSKFVEVMAMQDTTAPKVVIALKSMFAKHGIPGSIVTDNGPPFDSHLFKDFVNKWDVIHETSSPHFPRSNGMVERAVQTVKNLLRKAADSNQDLYLALLDHRTTPMNGLKSPAEMLMGRRLRTLLPSTNEQLKPSFSTQETFARLKENQNKQKQYADQHSRTLKPLDVGQPVWWANGRRNWEPATVIRTDHRPRSYIIGTSNGSALRRNRSQLRILNKEDQKEVPVYEDGSPNADARAFTHAENERPADLRGNDLLPVGEGPSEEALTPPPSDLGTSPTALSQSPDRKCTRSGRVIRTPIRYRVT